jgi:GntR family transcriptional repressor for pyruvate dehydrogenase complex
MDSIAALINDGSRADRAVGVLTELITSGKLVSGDFLPSEPELSRRFGVSRPTIRQALRTLETRGLVATKHGVGVKVVDRTREVATDSIGLMLLRSGSGPQDLLEVRRMLECQGAALAAQRATEEDVHVMAAAINLMRSESSTVAEYVEGDLNFHLRLAESSKNGVLVALTHAIRGLLLDAMAATYSIDGRTDRRLRDHTRVLEAIAAHNPVEAEAAMQAHLQRTEDMLRQARVLDVAGEDG